MAKSKTENNRQKTNYNARHYDQVLIRVMLDGSSGYTIEDIQAATQTGNMTQSALIKAAISTYCGHLHNLNNQAPAVHNLDANSNRTSSPATKKFKSIQLRVKKDGSDNFTVSSLNQVAANAHMTQNDYINAAICSYLARPADYRDTQIGDAVLEATLTSLSPENDD